MIGIKYHCKLILLSCLLSACAVRPTPSPLPPPAPAALTVAAASDLQFAFEEIAVLFEQETEHPVTLIFGSSGLLTQQIENGAPYDLFASASLDYIERLDRQGLVAPGSAVLYARGRLVLAVNREAGVQVDTMQDLLDPEILHVAIANPSHAPYGQAAVQSLQTAGIWEAVQPKIVYGENVRQALQYIQTGDAQAGLIALSIANVPEIRWQMVDESQHKPLEQALAVVAASRWQDTAARFSDFVNGEQGRPVMAKYGFLLPEEQGLPVIPEKTP